MTGKSSYGPLALFDISPSGAQTFAATVAKILQSNLRECTVEKFPDGETDIQIPGSVRGRDVFVFQSHVRPQGERLYELMNFVDAVKTGGSARRVTVVMPYLFGQRGERRTRPRQPVPAAVTAKSLYANGADNILAVCVHTTVIGTIYNTTNLRFENFEFEHLVANYVLNHATDSSVVIASPDVGGPFVLKKSAVF